jgi:protein ImuB
MYGAIYAAEGASPDAVIEVAREFSPRIEIHGPREVTLDLDGVSRLFGDPDAVGQELLRTAAERGIHVRAAIAGTRTAARLLARGTRRPFTAIVPGTEAAALAQLPLRLLTELDDAGPLHPRTLAPSDAPSHPRTRAPSHRAGAHRAGAQDRAGAHGTFERWGLRTLGDVARLPADAVAARLGQDGVRWQRLARGEDLRPLLPAVADERFEQAVDLEWPIEGLEPLSFVLGRLIEPLAAHLDRRGRGAAVLHVRLHLVTRVIHERSLELPAPMKDARTLRTLALLDLESHPPAAAIDRVVVTVDPTPARVIQFSLLTRPLPSPEQVSTLMARLGALMGDTRCGSPVPLDSWRPGAFGMKAFHPGSGIRDPGSGREKPAASLETGSLIPDPAHGHPSVALRSESLWPVTADPGSGIPDPGHGHPSVALRRFRLPVPARVRVEGNGHGRPVRVATDRRGLAGGAVERCAGPWRTTGEWWSDTPWDRDEWDVTLGDGATYRIFRDRATEAWFLEGVVD